MAAPGRTVVQQLVSSTKNVSTNLNARLKIAIHETGNEDAKAGARSHANLQSRPNPRVASWHYQVDWLLIIQSFLHIIRCFHAGNARGNREAIAIEICVNSREHFREAVANAAWLTAQIMRQENIPLSDVVQHNAYSGKDCPDHLRSGDWGVTWADFLNMVRAELGTPVAPPPAPVVIAPPPAIIARPVFAALLVDGSWGAQTTRALQWQLRTDGHYGGLMDGDFGPMTKRALQSWLKGLGVYGGLIDGDFGPMTRKALQTLLRTSGFYTGLIDGDFGRLSTRALQTFLNSRIHTWKG